MGLKYLKTRNPLFSVLNLTFSVPCDQCPAGTYTITGTASDPENYTLNFVDNGTYTVSAFDLTLTVNNGVITYGDVGPFDFGYTLSLRFCLMAKPEPVYSAPCYTAQRMGVILGLRPLLLRKCNRRTIMSPM